MAGDLRSAGLRHATVDSPFGDLLVVRGDRGIVRVAFPEEDPRSVLEELEWRLGARSRMEPGAVAAFARAATEYFEGRRRSFSQRPDLRLAGGFARRVLDQARRIPYGAVATYGELARRAGSPRAARAAGNAMRTNPVPLLVPCHRVVPADGSVGGYAGREDRKVYLLELEAAELPGRRSERRRPSLG